MIGANFRFENLSSNKLNKDNLNSLAGQGNVYAPGGLFVNITPIRWLVLSTFTVTEYAGATAQAVAANQTSYVYLDAAGTLFITTGGFPSVGTSHVPLATVITDGTGVISINDKRIGAVMP